MNAYERKTLQELVDAAHQCGIVNNAETKAELGAKLDTASDLLKYDAEHERHIYIAIGPNVWGKGFTEDTALANACRESSEARKHHIIYRVNDPWAYVDGMGSLCYAMGTTCEEVRRVEPKQKKGGRR